MFIITTDKIDAGASANLCGPRGISDSEVAMLRGLAARGAARPEATHFRMFDDDGVHYYSGYWVPRGDATEFEPLDCFGRPNAGCTTIKVRGGDGSYSSV